jgi:hypothetical protein
MSEKKGRVKSLFLAYFGARIGARFSSPIIHHAAVRDAVERGTF